MATAAITAFITIFILEFGDKTQLVSLALACRFPPLQVLAGAMVALSAVIGLAVGAGHILATTIPHSLVALLSGIIFIIIGIIHYFRKEPPVQENSSRKGFLNAMGLVFIAEFGDKTQLAALFLAASFGYPLAVFAGAMLAMLLNHLLAVYVGSRLLSRLNPQLLKIIVSLLFIIIGAIIIFI